MNHDEQLLLEAMKNMLDSESLGLGIHKDTEETSHHFAHNWEGVEDLFHLKTLDSPFQRNLTSTFRKIHSYKYLDDPTFLISMKEDLKTQAVPLEAISLAEKALTEVRSEMDKIGEEINERDAGWNPAMDEIKDLTTNADQRDPKREDSFTGGGPNPPKEQPGF